MLKTVLAGAAALAFSVGAHAVTVTSTPFDVAPGAGETLALDFESTTPPAGYTITGTGFGYYTGSTANVAAAPFGDSTQYFAVRGGGTATITLPSALRSFSMYVGSVDFYNSVTLTLAGGGTQTFTGTTLPGGEDGNQTSGNTNRRYFFVADAGERITGLTLSSGQNSFEIDNLATGAVPEPATWALMIAGIGMVGVAQRRRRNVVAA
ncbi:PEPxxWA-CTERM sorting domain-containing protein [Glacieibacterium sp.]|uniref:Npun_F0296 family exosortase-dependent surface protein n=1 Tax=Glacieibacterium sp. TaxID=2860237 RepID=UPI003B009790